MKFNSLALYFQQLEETASRNKMVEILSDLFKEAHPDEVGKISYLSQGRVAPLFVPLEFGVADKMMIKAIALAFEKAPEDVNRSFKALGDLGKVAEKLSEKEKSELSVSEVFEILRQVAEKGGTGSVEQKASLLAKLLKQLDKLSCRYVVRIPLGKMRLGFSDMTVLDALSWMLVGSKKVKGEIERAYNIRPDLGFITEVLKNKGLVGLKKVEPEVGVPIMMARAERLASPKAIIEKIGECAAEPKIDGFRLAVHKKDDDIKMFTRNMEEVTFMYPDLVEGVRKQVKADKVIFEGEAVAYNPDTGEYLPFQETVQRKRKYDIEKKALEVPLRLFCFDLLYLDGRNFIPEPYKERRKKLEEIISKGETLSLTKLEVVGDGGDLEKIFQDAISRGLEGVMCKRLDGVYQAGARGWNWIKYKRSYQGKLDDTVDAVVMGYDFGQGKRTSFGIGDFLIGVYDKSSDTFKTIAKIGTGLTDEEWRTMKKEGEALKVEEKPARYDVDKMMFCDVWVKPAIIVVIRADEISRSPVHTACRSENQPGFALRFPRLVDLRADKLPEDATTTVEIQEMYELQFKRTR
ncbi:MAG: ATP-dependent DNA ligase [bacterium]|nr:ATP-dependent DNA ligase [bacterium]